MAHQQDHGQAPEPLAAVLRRRAGQGGYTVSATGDSMAPRIPSGAQLALVVSARPRRGHVWCYVDDHGAIVAHRVQAVLGDRVLLRGDANPANDVAVPPDRLVGRVVGVDGRRLGAADRATALLRQAARGVRRRLRS